MNSWNSIEKILTRMMIANFNWNSSTVATSCYSPTNAREEKCVLDFYNGLSALARAVPKKKFAPTRDSPITKLLIEMAITFMNLLLKMNYVFSTPNFKNAWVNYGLC